MSDHDEGLRRGDASSGPGYEVLHAALVGAICLVTAGGSVEAAAHEGLAQLRRLGLPVPPESPGGRLDDQQPPFAADLADAPRHEEEPW